MSDFVLAPFVHKSIERFNLYPLEHPDIWAIYEQMRDCFWTEAVVRNHLASDKITFASLTPSEHKLLKVIFGFFTVIDSIIMKVIGNSYLSAFLEPEFQLAFSAQNYIEGIHQIVYNEFIKIYYNGDMSLFLGHQNDPIIKRKIEWIKSWLAYDDIRIRVFIQTLIEGVDIVVVFGIVFWFKSINKMVGFASANEYIEIDEYWHKILGITTYRKFTEKLPFSIIKKIIFEYMEITEDFYSFMKEESYVGLNYNMVINGAKYLINEYIKDLGYFQNSLGFGTPSFSKPEFVLYEEAVRIPYLKNRDIGTRNSSFFTKLTTDYKDQNFTQEDLEIDFSD